MGRPARGGGAVTPRVSVLLPVRNAARWLDGAVASIRAQTHRDFELLVHDDGSTDATWACVQAWCERDLRIRATRAPARGIVAALEALRAQAQGELLARMDADDVAHPLRFARQLRLLDERPGIGWVSSRVAVPRGARPGMHRYARWLNARLRHEAIVEQRFVESPLPHPTWMVRRAVLERVGGYRDGPFSEDYDLFLRAVRAGVRFAKCPEVLLLWRDPPERLSRVDPRCSLEAFRRLKAEHVTAEQHAQGHALALLGEGRFARRWLRRLQAAGADVQPLSSADLPPAGTRVLHLMPRVGGSGRDAPPLWCHHPDLDVVPLA